MGTRPSKTDSDYAATVPLTSTTTGLRKSLTDASGTATVVAGARYKARLIAAAGSFAWFEHDGTATLPADNTSATGFWLDAGESEIVIAGSTSLSGIMATASTTGTLLLTRLSI